MMFLVSVAACRMKDSLGARLYVQFSHVTLRYKMASYDDAIYLAFSSLFVKAKATLSLD